MTQAGEIISSSYSAMHFAQVQAKNAQVLGTCPIHGPFTWGDVVKANARHDLCPKCQQEEAAAREKKEKQAMAKIFFTERSGVPVRYQDATFESYNPCNDKAKSLLATLQKYANSFADHSKLGRSLIFCGSAGTGKTHLACALLRDLAYNQGRQGYYCSAYAAIQAVRECYSKRDMVEAQVMQRFLQPDLLVLDEIGVQYGSDSEKLILFNILNGRYEAMKPSIVITNMAHAEIRDYLDRSYDRLRDNGGGVLTFDWSSWRQGGRA